MQSKLSFTFSNGRHLCSFLIDNECPSGLLEKLGAIFDLHFRICATLFYHTLACCDCRLEMQPIASLSLSLILVLPAVVSSTQVNAAENSACVGLIPIFQTGLN